MKMTIFYLISILISTALAKDVGILYEVWHSRSALSMQHIAKVGGTNLTTERVIQSKGKYTLNDVYGPYNLNADIYNAEPQLGFYCLYRRRPGDPNPPLPDCPNITQTATAHASMLYQGGFDYIAIDITNWPMADKDGGTDIAVLRPTEVLFEEWFKLRQAGIMTPRIAVWPCSPSNSTTWRYLLSTLYNNASYADLIYTQAGKKVVFLPFTNNCYSDSERAAIESNGGRGNVVTIPMWALFGPQGYQQGLWGFFSYCVDGSAYTTSMIGVGACNQYSTLINGTSSVIEISASGGYMLSQCALPFASPGHLRGLTVARLFEKILAQQPPHVFMSSFNEFIGGRQAPAYGAKIAINMGLPNDPQRASVWVDTYASEFSRDIEPSVEGGNRTWIVATACVQLYKAGKTCEDADSSNPCCTREDKEIFANQWSLARKDGTDALVTNLVAERNALINGGLWVERCNAIGGPTVFCANGAEPDGRDGPFMTYNVSIVDGGEIPVRPLYRCVSLDADKQKHFLSTDRDCEGLGAFDTLLGYIATIPGREMLRALWRCKGAAAGGGMTLEGATTPLRYHALDLACDVADGVTPLGYVR